MAAKRTKGKTPSPTHSPQASLHSSAFKEAPLCHGQKWQIVDEVLLASTVARLLLGQYRHVSKILRGADGAPPLVTNQMIDRTIEKLRPNTRKRREHRDGWLFQFIAWLAASAEGKEHILLSPPHNRPADKGFDALIIQLEREKNTPKHLIVSEEKATTNPRNKFQQQVLPEFCQVDAGERDTELMSEVTTLLESSELEDIDRFLNAVFWSNKRRYRACLTVTDHATTSRKRKLLLKGYDKAVGGSVHHRRAELFGFEDLRQWMNEFSELLVEKLEELRPDDV